MSNNEQVEMMNEQETQGAGETRETVEAQGEKAGEGARQEMINSADLRMKPSRIPPKLAANTSALVSMLRGKYAVRALGKDGAGRNIHRAQIGACVDGLAVELLAAGAYPDELGAMEHKLPKGSEALFAMRQSYVFERLATMVEVREEEIEARRCAYKAPVLDPIQIVQIGGGLDPLGTMLAHHVAATQSWGVKTLGFTDFVVDQQDALDDRRAAFEFYAERLHEYTLQADSVSERRLMQAQIEHIERYELGASASPRAATRIPFVLGKAGDSFALLDRLVEAGWDSRLPTVFVAMGLTYYLPDHAIRALLHLCQMANDARPVLLPGTSAVTNMLMLDYACPAPATIEQAQAEEMLRQRGEPILFKTPDITPSLHAYGADWIEDTSFLSYYSRAVIQHAEIHPDDKRHLRFVTARWAPPSADLSSR